jgi:DNA-binding NarL/FixJ family response regulator
MKQINVSIVEDDERVRESLAGVLDATQEFRCLKTYGTGEDALKRIPDEKPDILLMDIQLPRMSGIECVARIKEKIPDLPVVMLTVFEDSQKVFQALEAGACGYLVKRTPAQDLLGALRQVHGGGAPMTGRIARMVVQSFQRMGTSNPRPPGRGRPVQGNRGETGFELAHRSYAFEKHLRETACPLANPGGYEIPRALTPSKLRLPEVQEIQPQARPRFTST